MKREYYMDGEKVSRYTFFKQLEATTLNMWRIDSAWFCFEEYYAYTKAEIRQGKVVSYGHTFWSEVVE